MIRIVHQSGLARLLLLLLPLLFVLAACVPNSGIFASGNWQAGALKSEHIRAFAVDPNNAQNIYAGDMQDGVFVSTDGGTTWKQQQNGLPPKTAINALAFNDSGKKLYAVTDVGVYLSADGAKDWSAVAGLQPDRYSAIAFDLKTAQTIYVGSAQHGVLSSLNSGASWSGANNGLPIGVLINGLAFDSDAHQLWAATSMGIYRSPDGGASWQALNNELPAGIDVYAVLPASIYGGARGLVYAATNKGFYLSQDSAAHWQTSQTQLTRINIYAVIIDIHTVTTVYIATGTVGVLRSNDSGENWDSVGPGLPSVQTVYALAQGANGYDQLFAAVNNIYLFPGTSSILDPTRLLPFLLIIAFFYLLYRLNMRGRNRARNVLKPERIAEPEGQENL